MTSLQTLWQGFRFGMLLQLAIGPICVFIFQTAVEKGFQTAGAGALGVALIDAIYIFAAASGVGVVLERKVRLRTILHRSGALFLIGYGGNMIWSAFQFDAAAIVSSSAASADTAFLHGAVLTLSSPLTIIFWISVFAAELSQREIGQDSIFSFGTGAVCATLCFLTTIAAVGSAAQFLLSPIWQNTLHFIAGLLLISFGLTKLQQKI